MSIVYNLVTHLQTVLPSLIFVANGWLTDTPEESLNVIDNGGEDVAFYPRKNHLVQVISRASSKTKAQKNAQDVFEELRNRFGLELPAVTVDGESYDAVKTYQISPNQIPGYIGSDDSHLEMWSVNFRIITF